MKAGTATLSLRASLSPSTDPARVLSRNRDYGVDLGSEVYRMLREPAEPPAAEPKQSGSFRYLQGMLEASEGGKTPTLTPPAFPLPVGPPPAELWHPTSCLPAVRSSPSSSSIPTLLVALQTSSPVCVVVAPEAGSNPTPPEVKFFPFLTSACLHRAHATRAPAFRRAAGACRPPEPQAHGWQVGRPTEWPAGATRVHALRPRHRVSTLPCLSHPDPSSPNPTRHPVQGVLVNLSPHAVLCLSHNRGTIVKARDKLYHPECFMCSDCGLNLKQRGYFFLDERLYCESHAKARVKPPEGYDVVAVYPNAKVELV